MQKSRSRRIPTPAQNSPSPQCHPEARAEPIPIWQPRFYDFNLWTEHKRVEKLRYTHRNPLKRGLVQEPEQWPWSSFRCYKYGDAPCAFGA